jgi:hypothetical protein
MLIPVTLMTESLPVPHIGPQFGVIPVRLDVVGVEFQVSASATHTLVPIAREDLIHPSSVSSATIASPSQFPLPFRVRGAVEPLLPFVRTIEATEEPNLEERDRFEDRPVLSFALLKWLSAVPTVFHPDGVGIPTTVLLSLSVP